MLSEKIHFSPIQLDNSTSLWAITHYFIMKLDHLTQLLVETQDTMPQELETSLLVTQQAVNKPLVTTNFISVQQKSLTIVMEISVK